MLKFRANGEELVLPDDGTFSFDEWIVVYNYSGLTADQAGEIDGIHPGLLKARVHIAVARANPDQKAKDIEQAVGGLNMLEILQTLQDDEEKQEEPPDLGSRGSSDSNEPPSGSTSRTSSETSPDPSPLRAIGTPGSDSSESVQAPAPMESAG